MPQAANPGNGKPQTIVFVASGPGVGGGEKNLLDIVRSLVEGGSFSAAAVVPAPGSLREALEELGVPVLVVEMAGTASRGASRAIADFARGRGAVLLHAHGTRAALHARFGAGGRSGPPCVYTVHGLHYLNYDSVLKRVAYTCLDRYLKARTAAFICVCESDLRKGVAAGVIAADRAHRIYNGIGPFVSPQEQVVRELRENLGLTDRNHLLVNIARFHRQKGHPYLLRAMREVGDRYPDARLLLVGDGPTRPRMRTLASELGLGESVKFVGERGDGAAFIALADVVVVPSLWEGLPYTVLEALAAGKAVVASDVDGIPEVITDGESGLLVPPKDPHALAGRIIEVLDNPQRAAAIGRRGAEVLEKGFRIEEMCAATLKLYGELAQDAGSHGSR